MEMRQRSAAHERPRASNPAAANEPMVAVANALDVMSLVLKSVVNISVSYT
jgi:hypothetical protein